MHCSVKSKAPWANDVLKSGLPDYPYEARSRRWEGDGWFQMHLRPDGTVESVKTLKSVGYPALDQAAIATLTQWRFKPGKWKSIDYPIYFSMHRSR
jgi:protein TonB